MHFLFKILTLLVILLSSSFIFIMNVSFFKLTALGKTSRAPTERNMKEEGVWCNRKGGICKKGAMDKAMGSKIIWKAAYWKSRRGWNLGIKIWDKEVAWARNSCGKMVSWKIFKARKDHHKSLVWPPYCTPLLLWVVFVSVAVPELNYLLGKKSQFYFRISSTPESTTLPMWQPSRAVQIET